MNVYFSFDYELYFGDQPGTVRRCLIEPTEELIRIGKEHNVRFVFFVDIGFLIRLDNYRSNYAELEEDYRLVVQQIKDLSASGHDVQLHIHPHWEDTVYDGKKWVMNVTRYKLADFSDDEATAIVRKYKAALDELTGKQSTVFRAGGWCIQPFDRWNAIFRELGIRVDSSVFVGGHFDSDQYAYDFRNAPDKDAYRFSTDVNKEDTAGTFLELPIASIRNSPLFFWRLFLLGRKNPFLHKPLGDGRAMAAPGYRKKLLTRYTTNPVSVDGYNAHLLKKVLRCATKEKREHLVIIGHPKALSRYSLQCIERFVVNLPKQHRIALMSEQKL